MKKAELELYTDYLISTFGAATATGMSAMLDDVISHDRVTRFLAEREYTSKDLWRQVKSTVRQIEREDGVLIFDDTIQEKTWTDENEVMCWHYDHCSTARPNYRNTIPRIDLYTEIFNHAQFTSRRNNDGIFQQ
jgi:hypothetical protein